MTHGGPKEQPLPPDVMSRDDAIEVLRAFVVDGGLSIAFTRAFEEPDMWGLLLVDIARHAARAYAQGERIHRGRGAGAHHRHVRGRDRAPDRPRQHRGPFAKGALKVAIEQYHFDFMAEAIREAELSISQGGLPIGAVLTRDNKIIARGHNNRVQEKNVILHGEMSCLRDAGVISFHDTVMYTTLSPCSMCAGAIGLFKLSLLVIGESVTFPGARTS